MRKSIWIFLAALVVAVSAPNAHADSFSATFTCDAPCTATPTAPAVSFPSPTSLLETWDGFMFNHFLAAGDLPTDQYMWEDSVKLIVDDQFLVKFFLLDVTTGNASNRIVALIGQPPPDAHDKGTLTFTAIVAPEPSSLALIPLGLAALLLGRRMRRTSAAW